MKWLFLRNAMITLIISCGLFCITIYIMMGCAQIGMPTGGAKDTLPPRLIHVKPEVSALNVRTQKFTWDFDEYVELQDVSNQILISPFQKNNPTISSSLRTISIKLKDSLQPNTTYLIQFGNAIKDINEGNILKDYSYSFSTGSFIDSLEIKGRVLMAETGKTDSTLLILLYKNAPDTAVNSRRPDYIARLNGKGEFSFSHLPAASYQIFALKDGDGNKYYNSQSEMFAFSNQSLSPDADSIPNVLLFAYAEKKSVSTNTSISKAPENGKKGEKKYLQYSSNLIGGRQSLLNNLTLSFNNKISTLHKDSIMLVDTNYNILPNTTAQLDSTSKIIQIQHAWKPGEPYMLILSKYAASDSLGLSLAKNDTIRFWAKRTEDYGNVSLSFKQIDLSKHPFLQLVEGETVKYSFSITNKEWKKELMEPGEFDLRILFDENNNGKWDPGSYKIKLQPEITVSLPEKLRIRANWDNAMDIE